MPSEVMLESITMLDIFENLVIPHIMDRYLTMAHAKVGNFNTKLSDISK